MAFCVSRAKADHPSIEEITSHIDTLSRHYRRGRPRRWDPPRSALPAFFRRAFYPTTLRELLFLRSVLNWRRNRVDRFISALILGSLHGEMDTSQAYFSNQMPRTICLKPKYSLRYWRRRGLFPKKRRVFEMLKQKTVYRLTGLPDCRKGRVRMADSRRVSMCFPALQNKVRLVVTSPPYMDVTRYEEDQWLRLWFLGGEPHPTYGKVSKDDRHGAPTKYWQFLRESWAGLSPLLKKSATIVVRLGATGLTPDEMTSNLCSTIKAVFPKAHLLTEPRQSPLIRRQAKSFLPKSKGCLFEVDHVFAVR